METGIWYGRIKSIGGPDMAEFLSGIKDWYIAISALVGAAVSVARNEIVNRHQKEEIRELKCTTKDLSGAQEKIWEAHHACQLRVEGRLSRIETMTEYMYSDMKKRNGD